MKTTKKDFEYFQERCKHWIDFIGIKEWSVHYDHAETDGDYARTHWKLSAGVATIQMGKFWDDLRPKTEEEIDRLALHEVMHLVLAPLIAEATDRYSSQVAIDIAEHRIIRQIENLVRL